MIDDACAGIEIFHLFDVCYNSDISDHFDIKLETKRVMISHISRPKVKTQVESSLFFSIYWLLAASVLVVAELFITLAFCAALSFCTSW